MTNEHLIKTLFGENYNSIDKSILREEIIKEEELLSCVFATPSWWRQFTIRDNQEVGIVLSWAANDIRTTQYMYQIVVSACYKAMKK